MVVDLHSDIGLRGTPEELADLLYSIADAIAAGWSSGDTPYGAWWLTPVEDEDKENEEEDEID